MPLAAAHVLIPLFLASVLRDYTRWGRKHISKGVVLFIGISGLLPDLDVPVFLLLSQFSQVSMENIHRTVTHSLIVPLAALAAFFLLRAIRPGNNAYLLGFAAGSLSHIILDGLMKGGVPLFFPLSSQSYGLNLISLLVPGTGSSAMYEFTLLAGFDAALLTGWLVYEFHKKRIKKLLTS
ncbi:metal-dependent hydrolase [Candidatus Woesearchaeota archaeon]|nr:metal-dependent hydrolase [Candidatus Woesearchaeota archaeon]